MIISLDYSIKSPGITLITDDNKLKLCTIARYNELKDDYADILKNEANIIVRRTENNKKTKGKDVSLSTVESILDARMLASNLMELIEELNGTISNSDENLVIIEGFSFGSKGNRLTQLAGYQYLMRDKLLRNVLNDNKTRMITYSPITIKSIAGCTGKAVKCYKNSKTCMIERLLEECNNKEDEFFKELSKHELLKCMKDNEFVLKTPKSKDWKKPLDDIIDSIWGIKTYIEKEEEEIKFEV